MADDFDEQSDELANSEPSWLDDGGGLRGDQFDSSLEDETGPFPFETQPTEDADESSEGGGGGGLEVDTINPDFTYDTDVQNVDRLSFWDKFFTIQDNGGGEVIIKSDIPDPPENDNTYVLGSVNGNFQWLPTSLCP